MDRACIIPVIISQMPSKRNPVLLTNLTLISLTSGTTSDTKQVALGIKLGTAGSEFKHIGLVTYLSCLSILLLSVNFDSVLL